MLYSAEDLATEVFPEETYLVEGLIPLGGLALVHGKRGIGKSQFSLTLGHSIVNGYPFLGRFKVAQGPVVLVQIDMTPQITQLRLSKLWGKYKMSGLHWWLEPSLDIQTLDKGHSLVRAIKEVNPVLVVWDTLRKIHKLKENQSETAQIVYSQVKKYLNGPTHMFIHHDKKTQMDPQGELDPEEAFRGTSDWIDSVDTSIQLSEQNRGRLGVRFHKCRTMAEEHRPKIVLEMDQETLFLLPHGEVEGVRDHVNVLLQTETSRSAVITHLIARGICTRKVAEQFTKVLAEKNPKVLDK